jgi:hypothetical protein
MLSFKTALAVIDPDTYILKGLKLVGDTISSISHSISFTFEGIPILPFLGLTVALIIGKILEYQLKNNPKFKLFIQQQSTSKNLTTKLLIVGSIVTVIIFAI